MNLIRNWIQTADTRLREFDKKHHLFLGTPSWLVGVFLVMLFSGAACVTLSALFPFGASTAIFIVGAFAFLASFAIGWSFSIYRTRYIHLNVKHVTRRLTPDCLTCLVLVRRLHNPELQETS